MKMPVANSAVPSTLTAAALPSRRESGRGTLCVEKVAGRSVVTGALASSPLRLLTPSDCPGQAAWVFSSTFGGGLVAGDEIALDVSVGADAEVLLATQASTKVYRSPIGLTARQSLRVALERNSTCAVLPDPLTCYAGARFEQRLRFDLADGASLVLLDWLTSGRRARNERWAFARYASRIEASMADKLVFRDAITLDPADGPIAGEHRMGRCDCYGLLLLLGPRVAAACDQLLQWAKAQPIAREDGLIFSASAISGGAVVRMAASQTQQMSQWIRQRLDFVPQLLGADPWARKY